jgi:hypothetical protein
MLLSIHCGIHVDNVDYVTGIGNISREQYIQLGQSVSHPKLQKLQKIPKIVFFNTLDNIYQTETLASLKLGYPRGQGLLPTISSNEKFLSVLVPTNGVQENYLPKPTPISIYI